MRGLIGNRKILIVGLFLLFLLIGGIKPLAAELSLTQEELDYIDERGIITAASINGEAPLHYINSKGEITGIAVSTLDKIADMTGLTFEYKLYPSIEDSFASDSDIFFGFSPNYAAHNMILSDPYLKAETILFMNSSLDLNKLSDKTYAGVKGGKLPDGIRKEKIFYYNTREQTLDAVERGEADYGYGNEYSVGFYLLQNSYKNIITIPKGIETTEYTIGIFNDDKILLSIINKSIAAIDDGQMNQLILEVASKVERKITLPMVVDAYGRIILTLVVAVMGILLWSIILNINIKKTLSLQNKRYELLSQISNECIFEYDVKNDQLNFSEKCASVFGAKENYNDVIDKLKGRLLDKDFDENFEKLQLTLGDGNQGVFKAFKSTIYDDNKDTHYIIGKLINISEEAAEKEELIVKTQIDGLTEIYNGTTIKNLICERLSEKGSRGTDAFMLIDGDKFKNINDTFGHLAGDEALKNISKTLQNNFRHEDIIGRVGGDEFCAYMINIPSEEFVLEKCSKIIAEIRDMDKKFNLSVSIGIAFSKGEKSHDELFKIADEALYEAKRAGGGKAIILK